MPTERADIMARFAVAAEQDGVFEQVEKPEEKPAEQPAPEQAPETPASTEEQPSSESEQAPQEAAETAEETAESVSAEESDEVAITYLSELAEHAGMENKDDIWELALPVTGPDGQRREVTLSEWKDAFQEKARYEQQERELKLAREQLEESTRKALETAQVREAMANRVLTEVEQSFLKDYEAVDWDVLRSEDPAEYAAKHAEFQQRRQTVGAMRERATQELGRLRQEYDANQAAEMQQYMIREHEALVGKVKEFGDPEQGPILRSKLRNYLSKQGYQDEQIAQLSDHRAAVIALKAMKYDELQQAAPEAKRKLVSTKKVLRPGKRTTKSEQKQRETNELREIARKTQSSDAFAALFARKLGRR